MYYFNTKPTDYFVIYNKYTELIIKTIIDMLTPGSERATHANSLSTPKPTFISKPYPSITIKILPNVNISRRETGIYN